MPKTKVAQRIKFHGECRKSRHYAGHPASCRCGQQIVCDLTTTEPTLFAAHMAESHAIKSYSQHASPMDRTPAWVANAGKRWKAPRSSKPWEPKPFDVGDTVRWIDGTTNTVRTGQVWSGHPAPKTKWVVADINNRGYAVAVRENELVDTWLSVARAQRDRALRSNQAHDRANGEYWTKAVAEIERQLAELDREESAA